MKFLKDYRGVAIRLTDERLLHILEHPEMVAMEQAITETLLKPECVVQSKSDDQTSRYYRYYAKKLSEENFFAWWLK